MAEQQSNGTTPPVVPVLPAAPPYGAQTGYAGLAEDLDEAQLLIERGTTGLRRSAGYVREEILTELSGRQGMLLYRQMTDNDAVIGACLLAIQMLLRNVTWRIQPADQTQLALAHADFVDGALFHDLQMPWTMVLAEILTMLPFGWALFELIFKRRNGHQAPQQLQGMPHITSRYADGLIGWNKMAIRAQDTLLRWEFDPTGGLMGMHQLDPFTGRLAYIPYEKALLFRPTSWKESPEGRSLLRNVYYSWYRKQHIEQIEGIGVERDLAGLPVCYVPAQWTSLAATVDMQAQLAMIKRIVRNVRRDEQEGLVLPMVIDPVSHQQLLKFELLSSGGRRQFDTVQIINRYDLRIAQAMLCDLIFLGHEAVGSFALASSKTNLLSMALGGFLLAIADVFNRRAIPQLWRLNALPEETRPTLVHGDVESISLRDLGTFIKDMAMAGFDVLDLEQHVRMVAGFPEKEEIDPGLAYGARGASDISKRCSVRRRVMPTRLGQHGQLVLPFAA